MTYNKVPRLVAYQATGVYIMKDYVKDPQQKNVRQPGQQGQNPGQFQEDDPASLRSRKTGEPDPEIRKTTER